MDILGPDFNEARDDFNARWAGHIAAYMYWAKSMRIIHSLPMSFDFSIDFDRMRGTETNYYDLRSYVFLTKLLLSVKRFDAADALLGDHDLYRRNQKIVASFDGNLDLEFRPAGSSGSFHVPVYHVEYLNVDEETATNSLTEKVKGAYLIVQATRAAGLPFVDVSSAKPIEKYALQMVCEKLGASCNDPETAEEKLPINPALTKKYPDDAPQRVIAQLINGIVHEMADNIYMGDFREVAKPASAADLNMDDILAASSGPQP